MTDHGGAASPRTEAGKRLWREVADKLPSNRALFDGILAIEAEAAQEAPAPEGLRAALSWMATERGQVVMTFDRFIDALIESGVRLSTPPTPAEPPHGTICKCGLAKSYHPRLAADHEYEPRYLAEARPPEGLDPDRLARALDKIEKGIATRYPGATYPSQQKAAAIAAEYARLSAGGAE